MHESLTTKLYPRSFVLREHFFSGRRKIPAKMSWMNTVWRTITNTSDLRGVQKVWIPLFGPRQTPVQLRPRISDMKMKYPATTFSFFTGHNDEEVNKIITRTRLASVGFRSWSRFLAVNLQVTWVINPAVGCHYFRPGLQLPSQPLKGLLPILLLGEQRHEGCEQFAQDCYPTALPAAIWTWAFCTWVQHANHSATEYRTKSE